MESLWAASSNHDELAGGRIVHPRILRALERRLGVGSHPRGRVGHAGVLHTYGYLFSNLRTPFGLKRRRWVHPGLERSMDLRRPTLRLGSCVGNTAYVGIPLALAFLPSPGKGPQ